MLIMWIIFIYLFFVILNGRSDIDLILILLSGHVLSVCVEWAAVEGWLKSSWQMWEVSSSSGGEVMWHGQILLHSPSSLQVWRWGAAGHFLCRWVSVWEDDLSSPAHHGPQSHPLFIHLVPQINPGQRAFLETVSRWLWRGEEPLPLSLLTWK